MDLKDTLIMLREMFPEIAAYSDASVISYAQSQGVLSIGEWRSLSEQIVCEEREW